MRGLLGVVATQMWIGGLLLVQGFLRRDGTCYLLYNAELLLCLPLGGGIVKKLASRAARGCRLELKECAKSWWTLDLVVRCLVR